MSPVFVPAAVTREVLDWDEMISGLRAVYATPHTARTSFRAMARGERNWLRGLVSVPPASPTMGAKVFGVARAGRASYLISLFDQETAELVALVDGIHITALRTAATSALAVDLIAPKRALSLAVLGSGAEAQAHVRALARVRKLKSVKLYSPTQRSREQVATALGQELGVECTAQASAQAALDNADLVLAAARSHDEKPVFEGSWLRPGMLVVSIGSTMPEQREIDPQTIRACDLIVCDMVHEVIEETGDFIAARAAGVSFEGKMASLNDLVMGRLDTRLAAARLPMYKSVGAAVQDITVAQIAVRKALERGLATPLAMALEIKHV
jgi:ornithine cyclodeaminase/alanine dehydrogenase